MTQQLNQRSRRSAALLRRSSGDLVADRLRRQILSGELRDGQHLTQEDIAARLGTSRVPVREALVILEQEGWVKLEMHRGAFVLPLDTAIADNAEVWELVYGLIARRAVERMTPESDSQLAKIAVELAAEPDPATVGSLCEEYLDVLFDVGSAPAVARTVRRTRAVAIDAIFDAAPETIEVSRTGTLAVIKALRNKDTDRAVAAHARMQRRCMKLLLAAVENRHD
ncbi:GntR family transcriptional regulator [Mycobacterium sp. SMC-4]|uniref:GntR family transcriptional regulator n=1 Tax=Mycobacterium sp. SMC-4 TaxID=2857059 RepID=UPI0021B1E2F0|nr:GntR family transcriptional regulator [Mycobacterium sp. SMC-4]UXA19808.1 GntR family transcriptional regulator [Mycobacterium sp. SMC-4]